MLEDEQGFVLLHVVMWQYGDVDYAVPTVAAARERLPELRVASFDRGTRNPDNRIRAGGMLDPGSNPPIVGVQASAIAVGTRRVGGLADTRYLCQTAYGQEMVARGKYEPSN